MLSNPPLALVNHLLASADWARSRLAGHAGQTARLECGPAALSVAITPCGFLEAAEASVPVAVSIRLPEDSVLRALTDRPSLFSRATISGSAELAETLGFVFRNLHWDVEHDLSQVFGDIVARRAVRLAKGAAQWQIQGARNLAAGLAEYLTEEAAAVAARLEVEKFCTGVDALRDDFARVEKRLSRLERC